jgi:hypothetical protein
VITADKRSHSWHAEHALGRCAKSMSATLDDGAKYESIFDDLQQLEEEEQAGRAE